MLTRAEFEACVRLLRLVEARGRVQALIVMELKGVEHRALHALTGGGHLRTVRHAGVSLGWDHFELTPKGSLYLHQLPP